MALTLALNDARLVARSLRTTEEITLVNENHGYRIASSHLILEGQIEDIDPLTCDYPADQAKANCPPVESAQSRDHAPHPPARLGETAASEHGRRRFQ